MFLSIVSENRNDSCGTTPIDFLKFLRGIFFILYPSMKMLPSVTS